jgi:hypothetical protein
MYINLILYLQISSNNIQQPWFVKVDRPVHCCPCRFPASRTCPWHNVEQLGPDGWSTNHQAARFQMLTASRSRFPRFPRFPRASLQLKTSTAAPLKTCFFPCFSRAMIQWCSANQWRFELPTLEDPKNKHAGVNFGWRKALENSEMEWNGSGSKPLYPWWTSK